MWFIGVEVEQEMSTPPPKKNPGSAPVAHNVLLRVFPPTLPLCKEKTSSHCLAIKS